MKIVIADDHAVVRKGLVQILRDAYPHAELQEASDGASVLQSIKESDVSLVIMDISMPLKDGIETLKQLRLNGFTQPILILSVYPEDQFALRAMRSGASGFINKDVAPEQLVGVVKDLLAGRKHIS